jgi:hypothetical protein
MKRVKAVEDLNICIIGAGGIVGVGAKSLKFIDNWSRRARRAAGWFSIVRTRSINTKRLLPSCNEQLIQT